MSQNKLNPVWKLFIHLLKKSSRDTQIDVIRNVINDVGEYTGMCDKKGMFIFSGDYIQFSSALYSKWVGEVRRGNDNTFFVSFTSLPEKQEERLSLTSLSDIEVLKQSGFDLRWMTLMRTYQQMSNGN